MNNNENPKYVLKFYDSSLKKVNDKNSKIKTAVVIIVSILIIGSFIFQENLFAELNWTARILLISIAIGVMFTGKTEDVKTPAELRFYDEYLVLFIQSKYYSKKITRQEILTMKYKDISKCVIEENTHSKMIKIYGDGRSVWYNFKTDGSLPTQPTEDRTYKNGMIYFTTHLNNDIDFIKEIEKHSPLKVLKK